MPLEFTCPTCRKALSAPLAAAGQAGNCKFCHARLIAPVASGRPASVVVETAPADPIGASASGAGPSSSAYEPPGYTAPGYTMPGEPVMPPPDILANPTVARAFMSSGTPAIADFWKRFLGFGMDMVLIIAIELGLRSLLVTWGFRPLDFWMAPKAQMGAAIGFAFTLFAARVLYGAIFESTPLQATPGKWILGMKVCTEQGAPLSFPQALWRNYCKWAIISVVSLVPVAGIFPFFIYFYAMRDDLTQTLHDMAASTVVAERYY